jgi:glycosyltransferase 2 family protein
MKNYKKWPWRTIISAVVLLLFITLIVKNWEDFKESLLAMRDADPVWIFVAVLGMITTYIWAGLGYVVVAINKLKAVLTIFAQVAAAFANKLLPSGVGGLGLNAAYLHKNKHDAAQTATVVAVNSLAAFVSFSLLTLTALLIGGSSSGFELPKIPISFVIVGIIALLAAGIFVAKNKKLKNKITTFISDTKKAVIVYKDRPFRLLLAVVFATLVTLGYLTALYASAVSIGIDITVTQIFLVYVLGALATAVTPTPGGLGGAEAALYAGFVSFGVDESSALTATLIYRFITYWVPILPGYISFQYLQKRKLL